MKNSGGTIKALSKKVCSLLGHPWFPAAAVALAVLLTLPTLRNGFCLDDNYHRLIFKGDTRYVPPEASPFNLFCFLDGKPEENKRCATNWALDKNAKAYFFRPLSSLSHWLDYLLWPDSPLLMHSHSLLWLAALVLCSSLFFRFVMGAGWPAGLALLFFSIDYVHGAVAGWLANRNALLAGVFCLLCLLCHNRRQQAGWRSGTFLGPLCFVLSLLSAEAGIATLAYLIAHALLLEQSKASKRLAGLAPYVVILIVWRTFYTLMDFGAEHMRGFYVDPIREPLLYGVALCLRFPLYLMGQLGLFPITPTMYIIPSALQKASFFFTALLIAVMLPLARRDRIVRFWAASIVLALLPACAVELDERNLLFAGIGAAGLMAQLFACIKQKDVLPRIRLWRGTAWLLIYLFLIVHVVCVPGIYMMKNSYFALLQHGVDKAAETLPLAAESAQRSIIIVNNPASVLFVYYVVITTALTKQLKSVYDLTSGSIPLVITRPDRLTLSIRAEHGALFTQEGLVLKETRTKIHIGDRFELDAMTAQVTGLIDGHPSAAQFLFRVPLEDASLQWFCWDKPAMYRLPLRLWGKRFGLKKRYGTFKRHGNHFGHKSKKKLAAGF